MVFFFFKNFIENSLLTDILILTKAYKKTSLKKIAWVFRPKLRTIENNFNQFIFFFAFFNRGPLGLTYSKKKIYKEKEHETEVKFLGFRALTSWEKNKRFANFLEENYFLFLIYKYFFKKSRIKQNCYVRCHKKQKNNYHTLTFPFTFSIEEKQRTLWLRKFLSSNLYKFYFSFNFSRGLLVENFWAIAFFHFPLAIIAGRRKLLKKSFRKKKK